MTALKQEVSRLTGIYPDFYVMVEWEAIGELVDALGGVYFDVPFDMNYDDPYQDLHIHQEAGYRKLSGEDAMEVIRWRKNNGEPSPGDVGRIQIQQDFLSAVLDKCLQPATLLKAPALAQVFLNNVTTDLTVGNILAFAQLAIGMDPESDVKFSTMPYTGVMYDRASLVLPVEKELLEILNSGMNPYVDQIQSSDLQLMYKKSGGGYGVTTAPCWTPAWLTPGPPAPPRGHRLPRRQRSLRQNSQGRRTPGRRPPAPRPRRARRPEPGNPAAPARRLGSPARKGRRERLPIRMTPGLCSLKGPARGRELEPPSRSRTLAAGTGVRHSPNPPSPAQRGRAAAAICPRSGCCLMWRDA